MTEKDEFTFDHSKAYEPDGPLGKHIDPMLEIARKNGAPMLLITVISSNEEGAEIAIHKSTRNGVLPNALELAQEILRLGMNDLDYLAQTIDIITAANANIEHIRADLTNATQRVLAEAAEADKKHAN